MKVTAAERRFAKRILARAVAIATRKGDVMANQQEAWRLLVKASHKAK